MTEAWKQWEGQTINGEFHLQQYLGGCEHSAVFLTEYGEQGIQKAAIKLIPADPGNAELQLSRWRLAARLSHVHLLRLLQMGRCQLGSVGLLYVVMEYADEDLSQILPQRPLTPAEARDMLEPILDALAYLHSKGFVHGHIKPANIMAVDNQVKISSDGICRVGESSGVLGRPGVYDPPETARGVLSPARDVWSLGVTLVEALTQRLPVWEQTEQAGPVLPKTIPGPLLDIARHCLRRDPERRWSVPQIAARLHLTTPVPPEKTTVGPKEKFSRWRYFVPTAGVALGLLTILAAATLLNRRPEVRQAPSVTSEQPGVQPKPEHKPVTPATRQAPQKTSDEKPALPASPKSSGSVRSGTEAKTPAGRLGRGEVVHQVLPDVPQKASDTIRGTVRVSVRVTVDPSGNVVGATFDSPGPSKYFANLALQAAQRWKFGPARVDGRNVSSEWILQFEFEQTSTRAIPREVSP